MTGCMSISLKVVSRAAVCCALTRRDAMVRRSMLSGFTSSLRSGAPVIRDELLTGFGGAATAVVGLAAGVSFFAGRFSKKWTTSSFSKRPPGPDAGTSAADKPFSSSNRCAAGMTKAAAPDASEGAAAGVAAPPPSPSGLGATRDLRDHLADLRKFV